MFWPLIPNPGLTPNAANCQRAGNASGRRVYGVIRLGGAILVASPRGWRDGPRIAIITSLQRDFTCKLAREPFMSDYTELYDAILTGNAKKAEEVTKRALAAKADPTELVRKYMIPAMDEVGKRFECSDTSCRNC